MKKILIIGAGAMGSAFTVPCVDNNNEVTLVGTHLENELITSIKIVNNLGWGSFFSNVKSVISRIDCNNVIFFKEEEIFNQILTKLTFETICRSLFSFSL